VLIALIAQSAPQTGATVQPWVTAAIGGCSLLLGIFTAILGNWFVVRAKIREVDLLYRQKLADSYLATAREYTRAIYVPLNVLLSTIADAYLELREHVDFDAGTAPPSDATAFRSGVQTFITGVKAARKLTP
jgi:hypothetical protein